VALFSPDYLSACGLVSILLHPGDALSADTVRGRSVPPVIANCRDGGLFPARCRPRAFHSYADYGAPGGARPYLHMGYLPHAIAQDNPLLPLALLRTIERLEHLFPENAALLSIVKRNFAWRLKVQTAG
jgi:hypothetical protein